MHKLVLLAMLTSSVSAIPTMAIPNLVSNNQNTTTISKQVSSEIPAFNAAVRGAIINSGKFKVVSLDKPVKKISSNPVAGKPTAQVSNQRSKSDYTLIGKVASITETEDTTPLKDTNNQTNQYNISIAVDYKLVKSSDKSIMAAFTALGSANDVKIITSSDSSQKQSHNIPSLIQTAAKNLGTDVLNNLNNQFAVSSENYNNGSQVITDVKVYKD